MGLRIREMRQICGWTLDDLSRISGMSKGFLSDVENSKRDISSGNLLLIADALGVSIDYLVRGVVIKTKRIAQSPA